MVSLRSDWLTAVVTHSLNQSDRSRAVNAFAARAVGVWPAKLNVLVRAV